MRKHSPSSQTPPWLSPTPLTPYVWGRNDKDHVYSLEIVQSPLRARTCGFGTKDRRPLAPAAIAKMTVYRRRDNTPVHPDDVDVTFFVAMVELWDARGTENKTIIFDPSFPSPGSMPRRRRKPSSAGDSSDDNPSVFLSPPSVYSSSPSSSSSAPYDSFSDATVSPATTYSSPTAVYTSPPPSALSALDPRPIGEPWPPYWDPNQRMPSYVPDHESTAPQLPHTAPTHMTDRDRRFYEQSPTTEYGSPQFYTNSSTSHSRNVPMSPTSPHHSHSYQIVSSSTAHYPPEMNTVTSPKQALSTGSAKQLSSLEGIHTSFNSLSNRPVEVHNLLGPIHASAARLLDDQDRPGIFFVFQDLSIRTEGQFRLKINLMTIAAGAGTQTISSQDAAPVLAEAWTEPFNVYPPKRFPGVPDPTPLSTTFGRQGQKLPTRSRQSRESRVPKTTDSRRLVTYEIGNYDGDDDD